MFFLFHWLWPCGDRATIKSLNSWRQGWNWTELPVTWLPLPNDNLGLNQKKPLSAWLIQKTLTKNASLSWGGLFLFTSLSAQLILLLPLQSSPLSYKMCFLRMADAHYYREATQPWVYADSCTPLSRIVWGCQSRTPPQHRHTQRHTNAHTHFMPIAIHIGKSLTSEVKKNIHPHRKIKNKKSHINTEMIPKQSILFSTTE